MSMVSAATSEASRDSFATDPDMKNNSLLTIKEESKGLDESIQRDSNNKIREVYGSQSSTSLQNKVGSGN